MYYLEDHIKAIEGVKELLPARDVSTTGRHNILVDKTEFQKIRSHLMIVIEKWHQKFVEVDALPPEGYFPGPPRVKPIVDDGISSGENSWMSMSSASFLSMDLSMVENDDYFTNNQSVTKAFTYAEILLPHNKVQHTRHSSPHEDDDQKETFSDITGTRTSTIETNFKQEIERLQALKEKELQETRAIIEGQKLELQTLRENHLKEMLTQREKFEEVKKQNTITQEQMDMRLYHIQQQMRLEMSRMMEQFMHTNIQVNTTNLTTNNHSNSLTAMTKRTNDEPDNDQTDITRREKRPDTKKSPVKQQLTYGESPRLSILPETIKQPVPSAMDAEDECDTSVI
jgi:hypothetical protein